MKVCIGIDINRNYRMIIKPCDSQMPYEKEKIIEIEIIDIIDYH